MRSFTKLLLASLKEFARDRTSLSFTIILPLLLVAFFGLVYGASNSRLLVGIAGKTATGSPILQEVKSNRYVSIEKGSRTSEMARLHDGSIDAVVVIHEKKRAVPPATVYYNRRDGATALAVQALIATFSEGSSPQVARTRPAAYANAVQGANNSRLDFVVPGILATAVMWLGIFAAIPLVQQREQQVLRRFAVTPISRTRLVFAQVLGRLLVSLAQAVFILAAARILFGVTIGNRLGLMGGGILALGAIVLLGALAFVALGYAVAALSSTQSNAHAWAQLLTMPMLLLAGVFFPISVMPGFLRPLVAILPLTYLADALRQSAVTTQQFVPLGVDIAVLAAWVVVPMLIAVKYFRWI